MENRYLYKAKRKDNGEWAEGYYLNIAKINHFMCTGKITSDSIKFGVMVPELYKVDPETICRCTGLTDKNGKLIWENDIVRYEDAECDAEGYHDNVFVNQGKVSFHPQCGWFFTNRQTVDMDDLWGLHDSVEAEVIGNIFDNPELLEGQV